MKTKYYTDTYLIEDEVRCKKLIDLFNSSVKKDLNKWVQKISTWKSKNGDRYDKTEYYSPDYNGVSFVWEFSKSNVSYHKFNIVFINEKNPAIPNCNLQIFKDWTSKNPPKIIRESIESLRKNVFENNISNMETSMNEVSQKDERKHKLQNLELEEIKTLVEDSFNDWNNSQSLSMAKQIARTAYGYNKFSNFPYSEWIDKFKDFSIVINEIKKLENYE